MAPGIRAEALICCCCLRETDLNSLMLPNQKHGDTEIYADMIQQCYGFQIIAENDNFENNSYLICDVCVMRLREALLLRIQLEIARDFFQENFIKCNSHHKDISQTSELLSIIDDEDFSSDKINDEHSTDIYNEKFCPPFYNNIPETQFKQKSNRVGPNSKTKRTKSCNKNDNERSSKRIKLDSNIKQSNVRSHGKKVLHSNSKKGKALKNKANKSSSKKKINDCTENILEFSPKHNRIIEEIVEHNDHTYAITKFDKPFKLNKNDVTCKVCNETFPYHMALVRHMSIHFTKYVCHICGFRCATRHSVRSHILLHENQSLQTCEICNKTVKGNINLRKHVQRHISKLVFSCPQCSERFTSYIARVRHLHKVHNVAPRMHKCTLCPKEFSSSSHLSEHTKKYHLLERNHKCQECPSCFYSAYELKEHMTMHTGVKNFHCSVCSKTFARRRTLQVHMKIHNNVKDHVCAVCNKAFRQKGTLNSHMKLHEKVQIEIISNDDIYMIPELSI
ncbi:uncharacterized protein LOC143918313 [Arctopsyche grandis]|uniref:uncharacterized protein LOC143918313 n=1 Tax=Arctopsyche grandis TaxID=121162 RepID=UPI00406D6DB6